VSIGAGMRVKVWGCRGSVPTPGPGTVRCGGNTSCLEVSFADGTVLVLDAGTGIRDLGLELVERGTQQINLLLTHLHLDHVEGLRFFEPLWDERVEVDVWGPPSPVSSLPDLHDVPARVTFRDVPRRPWTLGGASLTAELVLHPGPTVGYRIEGGGASLGYLPDHEPALAATIDDRPRDWISGAEIAGDVDVLLHDAQYFEDEYEMRIGWGHSSVADAVAFTRAVGARRLVLFHHEPRHDDGSLEVMLAREGMVVELP
jgi:phosphoribosyl 1,2-cyclic phosphodiesterase